MNPDPKVRAWEKLPHVQAATAAAAAFATDAGLKMDAAGMTAVFKFVIDWQKQHGKIPELPV